VVGTLGTVAAKVRAAELSGPAIIIIGTVVTLRDKLDWRLQAELRSPAEGDFSPAASEKDRER
jgi:precorrin-4 methylase